MTKTVVAPESEKIEAKVFPLQKAWLQMRVNGLASLLTHNLSEKKLLEWISSSESGAKKKKVTIKPEDEFKEALYLVEDGKYYIPAEMFRKSIIEGGFRKEFIPNMNKTIGKMMIFLHGMEECKQEWVEIVGEPPRLRKDPVKNPNTGTWTMAYRGEFDMPWYAEFRIEFLTDEISPSVILQGVQKGGFHAGVGAWRAERGGQHGRYDLDLDSVKLIQ